MFAPTLLIAIDTVANANGYFIFKNLDIDEGTKFVIKAKNAKDRDNAKIVLDAPTYTDAKSKVPYPHNSDINAAFTTYLKNAGEQFNEMQKYGLVGKGSMLKEVSIKAKGPPAIFNSVINPPERADLTITPDQMQNNSNMLDVFSGKLGVILKNNKVNGIDPRNAKYPIGPMGILLDGQVIDDLSSVIPTALAGVQIYRHGFEADAIGRMYSRLSVGYGVIVLTTETRVTKYNNPPKPSMNLVNNRGYSATREFYSPAYKVNDDIKMADLRSTIYWKPDLVTDKDGKADLNFYTADEPGTYLVTVEGLDTNGHLARHTYSFEVKL